MARILLILGVTGAGKSTIINKILSYDQRFCYVKPYTDRIREKDSEKNYVTTEDINILIENNSQVIVNEMYGFTYVTLIEDIKQLMYNGYFPVLDFPIQYIDKLRQIFPNIVYSVYILPPNIITLKKRLHLDRKKRITSALQEIKDFHDGKFEQSDMVIVNHNGKKYPKRIANTIYRNFLNVT
ncbi:MAG TPA: hypothetical protein VK668_20295 [Mucilaginibacter sp.]|nr:hypothetical protein [Mucilaginibacter sp.]